MRVVAISQDPAPAAREFQSRHGARIETAYDPEPWPASDALGLTTVPTFFRVEADGRIAERIEGWNRERMRELARRGAGLAGRAAADIVQPGEQPPPVKPG